MATNMLARPWNFAVPDVQNFLQPVQQGMKDMRAQEQQDTENQRAENLLGMQRERLGMEQRKAAREDDDAKIARWGREANAIHGLQGQQRQVAWQRWMQSNPELASHAQSRGVDLNDFNTGPQFIATEAGVYDADKKRLMDAQIGSANASAALHSAQAGNVGKTSGIQEFEYAKRNGFTGSFEDWQKDAESRSTKYGLNPIAYQKPDGSIGYMVPSTSGQTKDLEIPGAGRAMPKARTVQMPTEAITEDQYGNIIRREQKDIAGKERAEEIGKSQGKAVADLPRIQGNADRALATIDQIEKHPGKAYGVGAVGVIPGIPGTRQRGFINLVDQAKGQTFLEAFNSLRGGGAITEAEGAKATQALARLDRAQSMEDFDAALSDLKGIIRAGLERARAQTTHGSSQAPSSAPTRGTLPSGVTYERID